MQYLVLLFLGVFLPLFSVHADTNAVVVEVKVSLDPADIDRALKNLHLDLNEKEDQRIFFYDTNDLSYFKKGLIFRSRKSKSGEDDDSTVKIRRSSNMGLSYQGGIVLESSEKMKCEIDAVGDKTVNSCSVTAVVKQGLIDFVFGAFQPISQLYSKNQLQFISEESGEVVDLGSLVPYGPIRSYSWKVHPKKKSDILDAIDVELWILPRFIRFLEFSAKTNEENAAKTRDIILSELREAGLEESKKSEAKTAFALQFYAPAQCAAPRTTK